MKKQFLVLVYLLSASLYSSAQITFQKTYGGSGSDAGYYVQQTNDGGYIITGYTQSFGVGYTSVYLIKTNIYGDTLWTKTYGGTNMNFGYCVEQTSDGGYIVTGYTNSFGAGIYDVYLIKIDSIGNLLWTKTYGGTNIDYGYSVQQTIDGGYIISGCTGSYGVGNYDFYLIKTDANGNLLWTKTFGEINGDVAGAIQQTSDGGYIMSGSSSNINTGFSDVCLIKTDSSGNMLWLKTFGGSDADFGFSVQQTMDGGYIVTGSTSSFGVGAADVYLIKSDSLGNLLWTKTFGGVSDDYGTSVKQTSDSGYIITAYTYSFVTGFHDGYLLKTNYSGDTLWTKTFGGIGYDALNSVQQTFDGGYIIAGFTNSFGASPHDVYIIKTDSMGNSGCHQGNPATIATFPATIQTSPATTVTSPSTTVTTPTTLVGSGGIVTTLCTSTSVTPSPLERAGVRTKKLIIQH